MLRTLPMKTAAAALFIASASALTPAHAGGSFSISIAPGTADHDRALRTGLGIYGLIKNARNGGHIGQRGNGNSAGLAQNGRGNLGIVHQDGNGHRGTLTQNGNNNAYGLFQFGRNTNGHVTQNGHGRSGLTFQFGW